MTTNRGDRLAALAATALLVLLLVLRPLPASRAVAIWIVVVAALTLAKLVRRASPPDPSATRANARFAAALRPARREPARPPELARLERELVLGSDSAAFSHRRLVPHLRTVAAARLASRHGVELDRRPDAARSLLGEDAWELLRPDRPEPEDLNAPGTPLARVEALVDKLEAL